MKMGSTSLAGVALLILGGCTTSLGVRPSYEQTDPKYAMRDYEYSLPMLQYEVIVSYELTGCPQIANDDGTVGELKFEIETVAAANYVAGERYSLDYENMASDLKVTDFAIETHESSGTLKAINASAEDKSADVIKSAVEFGVKAASVAAGVPKVPALASSQGEGDKAETAANQLIAAVATMQKLECSADAVAAMTKLRAAQKEIKRLTGVIAADTKKVEAISLRAKLNISAPNDKADLIALHSKQFEDDAALTVQQDIVSETQKGLVIVDDQAWPNSPFDRENVLGTSPQLEAWFRKLAELVATNVPDTAALRNQFQSWQATPREQGLRQDVEAIINERITTIEKLDISDLCAAGQSARACLAPKVAVHAMLVTANAEPLACDADPLKRKARCIVNEGAIDAEANVARPGVYFRQPERARLLLCDGKPPCSRTDKKLLLQTGWDMAPQLGQLRFVPMRNRMFQNNALSLSLREDGGLVKLQYSRKSAAAATATVAAADVATKLDDARRKREEDRKKAISEARAEIAYQRADIAYQRTEVAAIRTDAAAVRADEIAQIQFQIDKVTKDKVLLNLRYPDTAVSPEYTRETERLQAISTQLQARLAIARAEAELAK